jgi:hypothetical protein
MRREPAGGDERRHDGPRCHLMPRRTFPRSPCVSGSPQLLAQFGIGAMAGEQPITFGRRVIGDVAWRVTSYGMPHTMIQRSYGKSNRAAAGGGGPHPLSS